MNPIFQLLFRSGILITTLCLGACKMGPDYARPKVTIPASYKEVTTKDWKPARPCDENDRGAWWEVFHNPELNALEQRVNISNQNIALAEAQYRQSQAQVGEAQAALLPTVSLGVSEIRQKQSRDTGVVRTTASVFNTYQAGANASWELDLWGSVRRQVESSTATAQANLAQLGAARLSAQGTLAQDYFQLRGLDRDQKILDDSIASYQKSLHLTQQRFNAGVAAQADIDAAISQLKTAQAQAIENHIARAQMEHAIAVLLGVPPANFSLPPKLIAMTPPNVPVQVPSVLLERRPDIAQAERAMAAANAQIGVAIAAYFPTLTLTPNIGYNAIVWGHWFSQPASFWAIGPQLAETVFDGGLRRATTAAARASYDQSIATYRQTVLAAFQDVEDNLVSHHSLATEEATQKQANDAAQRSLRIQVENYKQGVSAYTDVIVAQTTAYTAEKTYYDVKTRRMVAAAGLIKALGGGWQPGGVAVPATAIPSRVKAPLWP